MKRNNKSWILQLSEAYIRQTLKESVRDPILDILKSKTASREDMLHAMGDEHYGTDEHIMAALGSNHEDVANRAFEDWGFRGGLGSPIWKAAYLSDHKGIRNATKAHPDWGKHPIHDAAMRELEDGEN